MCARNERIQRPLKDTLFLLLAYLSFHFLWIVVSGSSSNASYYFYIIVISIATIILVTITTNNIVLIITVFCHPFIYVIVIVVIIHGVATLSHPTISEGSGDILCFLTGQDEIESTQKLLNEEIARNRTSENQSIQCIP